MLIPELASHHPELNERFRSYVDPRARREALERAKDVSKPVKLRKKKHK